jgi:hypothetical protein
MEFLTLILGTALGAATSTLTTLLIKHAYRQRRRRRPPPALEHAHNRIYSERGSSDGSSTAAEH